MKPRRIAVLTSGGDAPGMNAALRAVVRMAASFDIATIGIKRGFAGLVEGDVRLLDRRNVGGIMDAAGTVLGSARLPAFRSPDVQRNAVATLDSEAVDALVVIGGNGSQAGAHALASLGVPVVGIASTIDNDLVGTDVTIGFDSAVSVAIEAIDRLRATAASHERVFLIEVMGRDSGHVALHAAVAGGAEAFAVPEDPIDPDAWLAELAATWRRKRHAIAVVAEGAQPTARRGLGARTGDQHREPRPLGERPVVEQRHRAAGSPRLPDERPRPAARSEVQPGGLRPGRAHRLRVKPTDWPRSASAPRSSATSSAARRRRQAIACWQRGSGPRLRGAWRPASTAS